MSIFSKQVESIDFQDILECLDEGVQENIRLEYKKEIPPRDELVKKVSSMSNTHGGYMVIGMEEDGQGNPKSIGGVQEKKGFKQQVIQWCFNEVYPPITPFVSNPIPHQSVKDKVVYVIYVDMSLDSPHFLTKRKGCYIRTDEFSQRFEPRLTTYEEIKFLSDRREMGEDKRDFLIERTRKRFDRFKRVKHPYHRGGRQTILHVNLVPQYPHRRLITEHQLVELVPKLGFPVSLGDTNYPQKPMYSQFESVIFPNPIPHDTIPVPSYLELNVWGQLSYFQLVSEQETFTEGGGEYNIPIINSLHLFSRIVQNLITSRRYFKELGYDGRLDFRIRLDNLEKKKIFSDSRDINEFSPTDEEYRETFHFSLVDNSIELQTDIGSDQLKDNWRLVCIDIWRDILFSVDEKRVLDENYLEELIDRSFSYLGVNKRVVED